MTPKDAHPVDRIVGGRVRKYRMLQNISQERLGEALGITFQQVQKYEKGSNRISASKLWEISKFLKVDIARFYEGIEEAVENKEFQQAPQSVVETRIIRVIGAVKSEKVKQKILSLVTAIAESDGAQLDSEEETAAEPQRKQAA